MADLAIGRNCPSDGTLTACAGAYSDELLTGTCAYCSRIVTVANPYYIAPVEAVLNPPVIPADSKNSGKKPAPVEAPPAQADQEEDDHA